MTTLETYEMHNELKNTISDGDELILELLEAEYQTEALDKLDTYCSGTLRDFYYEYHEVIESQ